MPKLRWRATSLDALKSDRGAVAAVFAILLGAGALMLVLGLVIDGGMIYAQKKNVQAAADDLSNALAQHCAKSAASSDCFNDSFAIQGTTFNNVASTLAGTDATASIANPKGGGIVISNVCGMSAIWAGMPGCASPTGGTRDCQNDLGSLGYANWVRVYTSTDPTGYSPIFANFMDPSPSKYIEYACSQSYWGQAASIPKDTSSAQLPFAIGICDALNATAGSVIQLVGDSGSATACANYNDRQGRKYAGGVGTYPGAIASAPKTDGTVNGFVAWNTTQSGSGCWTIGSTCTTQTLAAERAASSNYPLGIPYYSVVNTVMKNSLGKTVLIPVVDKNAGGSYVVKSYVGFTLLGYRMTTTTTLTATNAQKTYTDKFSNTVTISWGTGCPTPTSSSASCIAGIINPRVYAPYGQFAGISLTSNAGVPDFGYYIQRHIP
jgi:Flp pilus assembly protein TadG